MGRCVEDISCVTCGYTPPIPEEDGFRDYLERLNDVLVDRGQGFGLKGPMGYAK